jgi:hypothetical protein
VLNLQLVHYSPETLLKLLNLLIELFPDFHLQFVIQLLINSYLLIILFNLSYHLFNHFLHFFYLRRNLNHLMLHLRVLKNALRTEHSPVVFTVKLHLFRRMDFTVLYCPLWLGLALCL